MSDRISWTWRHAILKSGLPATTRHVLLTLGCHMSDAGDSCFPSQITLSEETGLGVNTVNKHLQDAKAAGWIEVKKLGLKGQKWKLNSYSASIPKGVSLNGSRSDKGISPNDEKVCQQVKSNVSGNISNTTTTAKIPDLISEALGNGVNPKSHRMVVYTTPLSWTQGENGCDLHLDLLPTIKRLSDAAPPRSISSWNYYRNAVFEARDLRLAEPNNPAPRSPQNAKSNYKSKGQQYSESNDAALEAALQFAQSGQRL